MNTANQKMLSEGLGQFKRSLTELHRIVRYSHDRLIAFGVEEKSPPGKWWLDGELVNSVVTEDGARPPKGATKARQLGVLTHIQSRNIAATSSTSEEVANRFHKYFIEGIDTTHVYGPAKPVGDGIDQVALAEMVERRVAEELNKRLTELMDRKLKEQASDETPIGIQAKPRSSKQVYGDAIDANMLLWQERAKAMKISPPVRRQRDRHIDGRWLRRAEKLWKMHSEGTDVAGTEIRLSDPMLVRPKVVNVVK